MINETETTSKTQNKKSAKLLSRLFTKKKAKNSHVELINIEKLKN